jgi:hypothetical protein
VLCQQLADHQKGEAQKVYCWVKFKFPLRPPSLHFTLLFLFALSLNGGSITNPPNLCSRLSEGIKLMQKTRGHHAPYTGTEESRYRTKCADLKRKITDVEAENDMLTVKIDRAKRSITRMRLERALLLEKLEDKTPAHVDYSEGSESEVSSVLSL